MRFVCFLLSLVTALTAVVTFMVALFSNFTDDPHNPVTPWARALFGDAGALVVLGLLAAILIWFKPGAAEKMLWCAAVLGVAGMVMSAITFVVSTNPTPPPLSFKVLSVFLSGAIPAVAAATGAIMTRRLLEPEERVTLA
jgi:hypothetical protein